MSLENNLERNRRLRSLVPAGLILFLMACPSFARPVISASLQDAAPDIPSAEWNDFQHLTVKIQRTENGAPKEYDAGEIFTVAKGDTLVITLDPTGFSTSNHEGWVLAIAFFLKNGSPDVGNWNHPQPNGDFKMVGDYAYTTITNDNADHPITLKSVPRAGCVPTFMLIPASDNPDRNQKIVHTLAKSLQNVGGLGQNIANLQQSSHKLQLIENFLIKFVGGIASGEKQKVNKPEVVATVAGLFGITINKDDADFKANPLEFASEKARNISTKQPFKLDVDTVNNLASLTGQQLGSVLRKRNVEIGAEASEILNISIFLLNMVKQLKSNYVFIPTVDKKTSDGSVLDDDYNTHLFSTTSLHFNKNDPGTFHNLASLNFDNTYQVFLFSPFLLTEPNFNSLDFTDESKNTCIAANSPLSVSLSTGDQSLLVNSKIVFKMMLQDSGGNAIPDLELTPNWIERKLNASLDEQIMSALTKNNASSFKMGLRVSSTTGKQFYATPPDKLKTINLPVNSIAIADMPDGAKFEAEKQYDLTLTGPVPCISEAFFASDVNKPLTESIKGQDIISNNGRIHIDLTKIAPTDGFLFVKRTDRKNPDKLPFSLLEHPPKIRKAVIHESDDQIILIGDYLERLKEVSLTPVSSQVNAPTTISVTQDMLCTGGRNVSCAHLKGSHTFKTGDTLTIVYKGKDFKNGDTAQTDSISIRRIRVSSGVKSITARPETPFPQKLRITLPDNFAFFAGSTDILLTPGAGDHFDRGFKVEIRSKSLGSKSKRALDGIDVTDNSIEAKNLAFATLLGVGGYGDIEYRIIDSDDADDYPDDLYWRPLLQAVRIPLNLKASISGTDIMVNGDFLERVKAIKSDSTDLITARNSSSIKLSLPAAGKPIQIYLVDAQNSPVKVEIQP
jgi:hypothetical protein